MPIPKNIKAAVEESHTFGEEDKPVEQPPTTVTALIPQHVVSSHGPSPFDGASRDGADSGIDVINVQETPLQALQTPAEIPHSKLSHRNDSSMKPYPIRDAPYPYFTESNYMRWGTAQLGRRATDPRETDRMIRLATASARQRSRNERLGSMLSDGTLRMPGKLITWHVAMESRPPLRIDMSGPSPTTYSPRNKPLYETNSPSYSFGRKDPEIKGGGQRAWAKLWFRSDSPFSHKTNYELNWPSASHYKQKTTLGPKQVTRQEFPSHSIGIRQNLKVVDSLKPDIPASNQYTPELANRQVWASSPSFTMGSKPHKEFWKKAFDVPAPNTYNPRIAIKAIKPSRPAFTVCGERRQKRHDVGPFFTL